MIACEDKMEIKQLMVGNLGTNAYIVGNSEKVFIVDPGGSPELIKNQVNGRTVEYILLTHSHIDHIGALNEIKELYPAAKVAIHESGLELLKDPSRNLSMMMGAMYVYSKEIDLILTDNMDINFLDKKIKVLHTPGHTPDGVCFLIDNNLFSGDTLFKLSIGRTDFPGGSYEQLIKNIKERIFTLPDDTNVFPGHMDETMVGFEKKNNPFLN